MLNKPIRSYREASRYSCTPISSLRAAIARGDVPQPIVGADGRATFDVAALDALRAARRKAVAGEIAVPSTAQLAPAVTASSLTSAVIAAGSAPGGGIAEFLLAAAAARDAAVADDRADADDRDDHAAAEAPTTPIGPPLGTTRSWSPMSAWPNSAVLPGASSSRVAVLERQVEDLQQQLAAGRAENARWRLAWRASKTISIAHANMNEALIAGAIPDAAHAAWSAAGAAVRVLSDEQLMDEGYAMDVGRAAGSEATWQQSAVLADHQRHEHGYSDIDLARARARRRPTRRW